MCGRQCLTLAPKDIACACKYPAQVDGETKIVEPEWRSEYNLGKKYEPSHNIAPTDITPVLVSAKHFDDSEAEAKKRVLVPMMWGMIPVWHKGDYRKHGLSTNNCRLESMLSSKLYSPPFTKGQRCVILCEGFYEWQTTRPVKKSSERAAYYIHVPQASDDVKIFDKTTWPADNINLLKMAGLYDIWTNSDGDKIYSYTVITFESSDILSWLHDRMPAILETEEQINDWLDFGQIKSNSPALSVLKPAKNLCWYQVSNEVNNSRNKSTNLNRPISKEELKRLGATSKESKMLTSWLIKKETRKSEDKNETRDVKKEEQHKDGMTRKDNIEESEQTHRSGLKRENENCEKENEEKKMKR